MGRSSESQKTHRVNFAVTLLKEKSASEVVKDLIRHFDISRRQAYRYVFEAVKAGTILPLPGHKVSFTVKLPESLVKELREFPRLPGQSISDIVTQALRRFLKERKT